MVELGTEVRPQWCVIKLLSLILFFNDPKEDHDPVRGRDTRGWACNTVFLVPIQTPHQGRPDRFVMFPRFVLSFMGRVKSLLCTSMTDIGPPYHATLRWGDPANPRPIGRYKRTKRRLPPTKEVPDQAMGRSHSSHVFSSSVGYHCEDAS